MTAAYLAAAALALLAGGQVIARLVRRGRATFNANTSCFPKAFRTREGRIWIEGPDGLYNLDGSADPNDQGWTLAQLLRIHGSLTRIQAPEQDPTT